jgi:beta-glucosidase
MSDWYVLRKHFRCRRGLTFDCRFGTYITSEAINAGLDLEMPGPSRWRGPALAHAVTANKIPTSVLNGRVRAVLNLVKLASKSGIPENAAEGQLNREEDKRLLRQVAAESIVLLKNEENILPLNKSKRIAVIGPNSKVATYCGGGSASLNPYSVVTPYEGMEAQAQAGVDFT